MASTVRSASLAVWDPTGADKSEKIAEKTKRIRITAAFQGVIGLVLALLIYLFISEIFGVIVCSIAILLTIVAFVAPITVYEPIKRGMAWLAAMVGLSISFVVLLFLYYLFFVPFGALFRRGDRNKLALGFASGKSSYWVDRTLSSGEPSGKKKKYDQQF